MWGTWLFTTAAYFSVSGYGHRHYLVMLTPAIAALVGIGVTALWQGYRSPYRRGWLLPLVVGMAAVQAYVLFDYPVWRAWLIPAVAVLCLVAAVILALVRLSPPRGSAPTLSARQPPGWRPSSSSRRPGLPTTPCPRSAVGGYLPPVPGQCGGWTWRRSWRATRWRASSGRWSRRPWGKRELRAGGVPAGQPG
jgi:hypothetical protein